MTRFNRNALALAVGIVLGGVASYAYATPPQGPSANAAETELRNLRTENSMRSRLNLPLAPLDAAQGEKT